MNVEIRGTDQVIRDINKLSAAMTGPAIREGMRAGALHIRELARANLVGHVDTGALWDSLRVTSYVGRGGQARAVLNTSGKTYLYDGRRARRKDGSMGFFKTVPFYGNFLEFGTVKMQGIHWMQRAGDAGAPNVINEVRASLMRTLDRMTSVGK